MKKKEKDLKNTKLNKKNKDQPSVALDENATLLVSAPKYEN